MVTSEIEEIKSGKKTKWSRFNDYPFKNLTCILLYDDQFPITKATSLVNVDAIICCRSFACTLSDMDMNVGG